MQNKKMMSQFSDHVLGTDRRTDKAKKKKKKEIKTASTLF